MPRIVGIDLGTTNSLVAIVRDGIPEIVQDPEGRRIVPSILHFSDDGKISVGVEARELGAKGDGQTIFSVKRFMGRALEDVREDLTLLPFAASQASPNLVRIEAGGREYTAPELSAMILRQLKKNAEAALGEEISNAVITVPAYFNDAQRQATKDAGRIAGLDVLRILNEPTAAALAYGLDARRHGTIAVYDFGGGTFDISILELSEGIFEVLATNGDTRLGGDDIDQALIRRVQAGVGRELTSRELQDARTAARAAKETLSREDTAVLEVPTPGYRETLTREQFSELVDPIIGRTLGPCKQALRDAGLAPSDIDEVVMVGGSTRIPLVRERVEELFGRVPHTEIDPDEVVALGAAVQADILAGSRRDTLLLDVTPLSLGIETIGGVMSKIIPRNSTIPASASESYTTYVDGQTNVKIHVLQGERELVSDCRSLAEFDLRGIPPMPAGLPRIEVRFLIDADGILSVSARELRTGQYQSIDVRPTYGLTDSEVEQMILESFDHAEADIEARLVIEARNEARTVLRAAERSRSEEEYGELSEEERARIAEATRKLGTTVDSEDHQAIRGAIEELNQATMGLAERIMNAAIRKALKNKRVRDITDEAQDDLD
jgi:Fe-S protein assembly chaperone HscA